MRKVGFGIKSILKENRLVATVGLIFSLIYSVTITIMPLVSQYLIDKVLSISVKQDIYKGILIFFCECIIQPLFYFLKEKVFIILCERISYNLRKKAFFKISKLPLVYYESHSYGEISEKIISDTKEISSFIYVLLGGVITSIISVICLIVTMFIQSWFLATIIVALFGIYAVFNVIFTKRFQGYVSKGIKLNEEIHGCIKQSFDNSLLVKIFVADSLENQGFEQTIKSVKTNNLKLRNAGNILNVCVMALSAFSLSLIYGVGALMIVDGIVTLGVVISMGLFFQALTNPLSTLMAGNINYNHVVPSLTRLRELYDEQEEQGDILVEGKNLDVEFRNVSFSYQNSEQKIFERYSLHLNGAGKYAILGKSGSGKSTFVKLLLGLYEPNEGELKVFGCPIKVLNKISLRQKISYVSQDVELLNDSIFNNLRIANPNVSFEEVKTVCEKLNIHNKIISLPDDYYSVITEKINLSGGERRKIAIARSLLKPAYIYIFDEAEVSLENEFKEILLNIFDELSKTNMVFVITHNKEMVRDFDNIVRLD